MRVLFTSQPGEGHWRPMLPLADALRQAGHAVAFATAPAGCAMLAAGGWAAFPAGPDETRAEQTARLAHSDALADGEKQRYMWPHIFAGIRASRALADTQAVLREWAPDLVVRDVCEFAGWAAAERAGIPHATVQVVAWGPGRFDDLISPPLNALRAATGLPPDPALATLFRYLLLYPFPPSLRDPDAPLPPTLRAVRLTAPEPAPGPAPAWLAALPARPTVYATLGTMVNRFTPVLQAIVDGLRDAPVNLILTVGRDGDPAAFGPQPAHVHIARYIPQSAILPHCDLVLTHGGSGTVRDALAHGLPLVILPIAADQFENARRCSAAGVARVVGPDERTPAAIRAAVEAVLAGPAYRRAAGRLRAELEALPGPPEVVTLLERLAGERVPVPA
jgi:UDP:flavonoid glycosyltransferase YjiC (YdhE family)